MTNQNDRFLKQPRNRNTWMYQRAIPKDIQPFYGGKQHITRSTKTERLSEARRMRDQWSEADNVYWRALRADEGSDSVREVYEASLVISKEVGIDFGEPMTFGEALDSDNVRGWVKANQKLKKIIPLGEGADGRARALEKRKKIKTLATGRVAKPVENIEEAKSRWLNSVVQREWQGKSPGKGRAMWSLPSSSNTS